LADLFINRSQGRIAAWLSIPSSSSGCIGACSWWAEIAARLADVGVDELDGPIVCVGAPFMPVPFARALEREYMPSTERTITAVRRALE